MPTSMLIATRTVHSFLTGLGLLACSLWFIAYAAPVAHAAGRVFYDGFEDGTTNAWAAGSGSSDYAKCDVVTSALDAGVGPASGTRMARCNWDGTQGTFGHRNQAMVKQGWSATREYLLRWKNRVDTDVDATIGSKLFRFPGASSYESIQFEGSNNLFSAVYHADNSTQVGATNWGCGPNFRNGAWHQIEFYVLESSGQTTDGVMRIWVDDALCWEATGINTNANGSTSGYWRDFHLMSNWSLNPGWDHDANNHVYWDEFEVYSDTGTSGTGSMSSGTITQGGGDTTAPAPPSGLAVQ